MIQSSTKKPTIQRRRVNILGAWLVCALLLLMPSTLFATTLVGTGRGEVAKNGELRIVFPLSKKATFNNFSLDSPARLVIDIPNAQLRNRVTSLPISNQHVQRVRLGTQQGTDLRIVVDMNQLMPASTALVKTNQGYDLVILISGSSDSKAQSSYSYAPQEKVVRETKQVQRARAIPKKEILIVIDPGHGGKDPGALGGGGTREKDVVLEIGKILRDKINRERGMKAIMTRDRDVFIPLRERVLIARRNKADMFISIHADAGSRTADGASVYILSTSGASSEAARMLAKKENRSDLIAGVKIPDKDDAVASMLLDISQDATIEASNALGKYLLTNLRRHANLHKRNVERAGFAVLKAPDIPSVLVETGFISNPNEERKLRTKSHQNQLADDILLGVKAYYKERPATELVYDSQTVRRPATQQQARVNSGSIFDNQSQPSRNKVTEPVPATPPSDGGVILDMMSQQGTIAPPPPPVTSGNEQGARVRERGAVSGSNSGGGIVFPELELSSREDGPTLMSEGSNKEYVTERGDTMKSIAQKFNVNEARLKEVNQLPANQLRVPVGTRLMIP